MHKWTILILFLLVLLFTAVFAYTHSGGVDANGGHTNWETGEYHTHRDTNEDDPPVLDIPPETVPPTIPYPFEDFTEDKAYQIIRIVDGDTVIIDYEGADTSVRLIGVDTPETVHPNKPEEEYGKEASMFLHNLLQGESVYLRFDVDKTDNFGRTLAYLYRVPDGLFVNLEIVRQGYGYAYTQYPFEQIDLFRHYVERARLTEKGLWAEQLVTPMPEEVIPNPADVNGDGKVNILDLVTVANAFDN